MKQLLVAVDFGPQTDQLLAKTIAWAKAFEAKVWLVHIAAPEPDFVGYDIGPQYIRDTRADLLREEHRNLQSYANLIQKQGMDAEGLLIQGATVDMIVEEAKKLEVDLIIMGHDEHGWLYQLLMGSTAAGVIKKADIPVLIVPF
ncbi:MAG: universal stress protein [Bacteroidota bacterium]